MTPRAKPDDISGSSAASHLEFNIIRFGRLLEDNTRMKPQRYSYSDLKKITNSFSFQIGKGGFGTLFKGKLPNETFVAVNLLNSSAINREIFINGVATMGMIHHENVVRLLGFCVDGFRLALVYEFLPLGPLDKFIFQDGQDYNALGVERLQYIAIGIAHGIEYLHQGREQIILHFDINPQNILLDDNYTPKISDFGLATAYRKETSAVPFQASRGTMGYIAPEMFSSHFGSVSRKSDIYSFGMLLLEMVGRRRNLDVDLQGTDELYFPEWVYKHLMSRQELRIQVEGDGDDQILKKMAIVGLWCIQWKPEDRPSMTVVLQMLQGSVENLDLPPYDFPLTLIPHPPQVIT